MSTTRARSERVGPGLAMLDVLDDIRALAAQPPPDAALGPIHAAQRRIDACCVACHTAARMRVFWPRERWAEVVKWETEGTGMLEAKSAIGPEMAERIKADEAAGNLAFVRRTRWHKDAAPGSIDLVPDFYARVLVEWMGLAVWAAPEEVEADIRRRAPGLLPGVETLRRAAAWPLN